MHFSLPTPKEKKQKTLRTFVRWCTRVMRWWLLAKKTGPTCQTRGTITSARWLDATRRNFRSADLALWQLCLLFLWLGASTCAEAEYLDQFDDSQLGTSCETWRSTRNGSWVERSSNRTLSRVSITAVDNCFDTFVKTILSSRISEDQPWGWRVLVQSLLNLK